MAYLIGILLALANIFCARMIRMDRDRAFFPVILAVVASYYVLFAAMAGELSVVAIEVGIMLLYLVLVAAGFRTSLWWIVAGLAAHGTMDAFHGQLVVNNGVPAWWPAFCGSFDLAAAVVLGVTLSVRSRRAVPSMAKVSGTLAAGALIAAITAQSVLAQTEEPVRAHNSISLTVVQTRPVGALGANIGVGYGITGSFILPLDRTGLLSLRADVGAAEYGSDVKRARFSESVGDRVEVNVRTVNAIVPASIGLQLTLPIGPVLTYATAGLGGQAFYTESRVEPTSGGSALASTVNQSDFARAWTLGGGIYVPLRVGSSNVMLDIGAQYIGGGKAQYLAPGSIADLPGGAIGFTPMESTTHLVVVRFGARIGL